MHSDERELERSYFATGCFWGAERRFWLSKGVIETAVGYMGGVQVEPTYSQVCSGSTGHTESVEVIFNPSQISYQELLVEFWQMHDPTTLNRQGNDIGTQYRSAIFYTSENQAQLAIKSREIYQQEITQSGFDKITTEILIAPKFWKAENYHQRYLEKNPNGYDCHATTGVPYPKVLNK